MRRDEAERIVKRLTKAQLVDWILREAEKYDKVREERDDLYRNLDESKESLERMKHVQRAASAVVARRAKEKEVSLEDAIEEIAENAKKIVEALSENEQEGEEWEREREAILRMVGMTEREWSLVRYKYDPMGGYSE